MASTFEALLLAQTNFLLNPPRFRGSILPATAITVGTNINYTTISEDSYSGWDATNHRWVVPVAGLYFVKVQVKWGGTTPTTGPAIVIYKTAVAQVISFNAPSIGSNGGFGIAGFVRANVGDQLAVQILNSGFTTNNDSGPDNNFFELFFVSQ